MPKKVHPPGLDTGSYSMAKIMGRTEDTLSDAAKKRRQLFALSYVQHGFNGAAAARAIGFPPRSAAKQACEMLKEPYTRDLVEKLKLELLQDTARMANIARLGMMREAFFDGEGTSHGARVSAFAHLGRWYGLDAAAKGDGGGGDCSGVMEIPMANSLEEWTQASTMSQAKLMEDVRK